MESAKFIGLPATHRRDTPLLVAAELVSPERTSYCLLAKGDFATLKIDLTRDGDANYISHICNFLTETVNGFVITGRLTNSTTFLLRSAWEESYVKFAESEPIALTDDYPQAAPVNVILSYDSETETFSLTWSDENFARIGFDIEIQENGGAWKSVLSNAQVWAHSFTSPAARVRARVRSNGIQNVSEWTETWELSVDSKPTETTESSQMSLENVDILRLLPRFMRTDKAVQGLAKGVGMAAQELDAKIRAITDMTGAATITEDVLDAIAEDRNIFWYDKTFPKEKKLNVITSADAIAARLGTKWAVEKVLSIYFSETKIQEWFEYGGDPFHYKIITTDDSVIQYGLKKLDMLIGKIKRLSVHLDDMNASFDGLQETNVGVSVHDATFEDKEKEPQFLVECLNYVREYEEISGQKLPPEFWGEYFYASQRYKKDPTSTKNWVTTQDADGNITSTNPYYETPPTKPVVDFNVVAANGFFDKNYVPYKLFPNGTNQVMFLPMAQSAILLIGANASFDSPLLLFNVANANAMLQNAARFNQPLILPKATNCRYMLQNAARFNQPLSLPSATDCTYMLQNATAFNQPLSLPNATNCSYLLYKATSFNQPLSLPSATNCTALLQGATTFNSTLDLPNMTFCQSMLNKTAFNLPLRLPKAVQCDTILADTPFNQVAELPSCKSAANAFARTGMSAENISATLDSLPTWTDGATHRITFTGSPGAAELTQESPSVAAAVAKGWTCEL